MRNDSRAVAIAETIMKRYKDPEEFPYLEWCYPHGYLLIGFARLWEATGDRRYYDYIELYCRNHVNEAGEIRGFTGGSMDDMMTGAILVWMYERTGGEKYAKACHRIRRSFDDYPRTREGGFCHSRTEISGEMWVDGVFMGQMFLCRYGKTFGEPECWREAIRQIEVIYNYCHKADGLLLHAYSQDSLAGWADKNGRSGHVWSEGLGWYALILAEVLAIIPEGFEGREGVLCKYKQLLEGLKKHQDPKSGLWFQVVDRGEDPQNWCDTSGSAMFLYAIKSALDAGIVSREAFQSVTERAYAGLLSRSMEKDGLWDVYTACDGLCVQLTYEDYINYPQVINAKEALCGYLWAMTVFEKE